MRMTPSVYKELLSLGSGCSSVERILGLYKTLGLIPALHRPRMVIQIGNVAVRKYRQEDKFKFILCYHSKYILAIYVWIYLDTRISIAYLRLAWAIRDPILNKK